MHPFLFYESFFFCSREDLERLQLLSRTLLDMVDNSSNVLPLRPIRRVRMDSVHGSDSKDKIQIFVDEKADYEASLSDGDFTETFRRLQHTSIKNICVKIRDSAFLRYWMAQGTDFVVVHIFFYPSETTGLDFLDFTMNHLRPRVATANVSASPLNKALKLLARHSFLNLLQTCWLIVHCGGFPPPSFILKEPGYAHYELRCADPEEHPTEGFAIPQWNVAGEIDGFIESFIRDGCTNEKLESVAIKWNRQSPAPKRLSKPTMADVPLPKLYMMEPIVLGVHRVTQCELHSFVSTKHRQRMDAYKWTIEYEDEDERRTAHLLQCRVKSL